MEDCDVAVFNSFTADVSVLSAVVFLPRADVFFTRALLTFCFATVSLVASPRPVPVKAPAIPSPTPPAPPPFFKPPIKPLPN